MNTTKEMKNIIIKNKMKTGQEEEEEKDDEKEEGTSETITYKLIISRPWHVLPLIDTNVVCFTITKLYKKNQSCFVVSP